MDRVEDVERDREGDRLSERNVNTERVLEAETDKEVSAMLKGYDLRLSDKDDERSPPKLQLAHDYRNPSHSPLLRRHHPHPPPPPLAMDTSSVRFPPVPVEAQAEMTSTYGHHRLNWPEMAKLTHPTTYVKS